MTNKNVIKVFTIMSKKEKNVSYIKFLIGIMNLLLLSYFISCTGDSTSDTGGGTSGQSVEKDNIQFLESPTAALNNRWGFDGTREPVWVSMSTNTARWYELKIKYTDTVDCRGESNNTTDMDVVSPTITPGTQVFYLESKGNVNATEDLHLEVYKGIDDLRGMDDFWGYANHHLIAVIWNLENRNVRYYKIGGVDKDFSSSAFENKINHIVHQGVLECDISTPTVYNSLYYDIHPTNGNLDICESDIGGIHDELSLVADSIPIDNLTSQLIHIPGRIIIRKADGSLEKYAAGIALHPDGGTDPNYSIVCEHNYSDDDLTKIVCQELLHQGINGDLKDISGSDNYYRLMHTNAPFSEWGTRLVYDEWIMIH